MQIDVEFKFNANVILFPFTSFCMMFHIVDPVHCFHLLAVSCMVSCSGCFAIAFLCIFLFLLDWLRSDREWFSLGRLPFATRKFRNDNVTTSSKIAIFLFSFSKKELLPITLLLCSCAVQSAQSCSTKIFPRWFEFWDLTGENYCKIDFFWFDKRIVCSKFQSKFKRLVITMELQ